MPKPRPQRMADIRRLRPNDRASLFEVARKTNSRGEAAGALSGAMVAAADDQPMGVRPPSIQVKTIKEHFEDLIRSCNTIM